MKKFLTAVLSFIVLFALTVPAVSQQAQRVGAPSMSSDQMMERLKQGMEERFDEMDEDEDGSLSIEEFKKMNTQERVSSRTGSTTRQRTGTSSTTSTRASTSRTSGSTQRTPAMDEEAKREREKELEAQFEKFDENEDGKLTKEEYLEAEEKSMRERMEQRAQQQRGGGERQGQRQGRSMPSQRGP